LGKIASWSLLVNSIARGATNAAICVHGHWNVLYRNMQSQ